MPSFAYRIATYEPQMPGRLEQAPDLEPLLAIGVALLTRGS
ncbi:MAG: hypothetical protein ACRDIX_07685 [Actinomycetota bacterium]